MDESTKRWFYFLIFAFLMLQLFAWLSPKKPQEEQPPRPVERVIGDETPRPGGDSASSPTLTVGADPTIPRPVDPAPAPEYVRETGEKITVETEFYRVVFDSAGAFPTSWQIIDPRFAKAAVEDVEEWLAARPGFTQAPYAPGDFLPMEVIPEFPGLKDRDYPLMVILKENGGRYIESLNRRSYTVEGPTVDGNSITLAFISPVTQEGLQLKKTFVFERDSYMVRLQMDLTNLDRPGAQNFAFTESFQPGIGLLWGPGLGKPFYTDRWDETSYMVAAYDGKTILSERFKNWKKVLEGERIEHNFDGRFNWGLIESRFFMAVIIPETGQSPLVRGLVKRQSVNPAMVQAKNLAHPISAEIYSEPFQLRPGESRSTSFNVFVGPKQLSLLKEQDSIKDNGLSNIPFHNSIWLIRVLVRFMLGILALLIAWTHNYGLSIILLTITMRLLTQPLTHIGMKSQAKVMAEQQRIKPLIDAIREKHKDDPQKMNSEIWKTYREHGVNPLGMLKGCVWMLVQLPIFFALYRLLMGAIDLRGESFLWIKDLTAPDALFTFPFSLPLLGNKFNILPILMGVSQVFAQRLQTTNIEDPNQKMMTTMMPIIFIFILYNFPAGLSLYWFVSNLWQIAFQLFVNKRVKEEIEKKVHQKFEERQKAGATAPFPTSRKGGAADPGMRERFMGWLEKKTKESEKKRGKR